MKAQAKKILTGLTIPQEYACVAQEEFQNPLTVFLTLQDRDVLIDVTNTQLFLGYKPLIMALTFRRGDPQYECIKSNERVCLNFNQSHFDFSIKWRGFHASSGSIARLLIKKIAERDQGETTVLFYEGDKGEHSFLNPVHRLLNGLRESKKKRSAGNVGLPGNLADQVRIAYALPRIISVITLSDGSQMNMFPTDLHGEANEKLYIGSLRTGGLANQQVEQCKRIVISEVESFRYKEVYAMGKNHMKGLREKANFSLHNRGSAVFDFPLPEGVIQYRELKHTDSFDRGIHRIHIYEIVNREVVKRDALTLAHIHQYYAQWRLDHKLDTEFLWR